MEFTNKVQKQFKEAGWKSGRNVISEYDPNFTNAIPDFLKEFLREYGNLEIEESKTQETKVINKLFISPKRIGVSSSEVDGFKYVTEIILKELYEFAYFYPDNYYIACDEDGKVYMLGDYVFLRSDNFKEGIEKIVMDDWSGSLELDEETGEWKEEYDY